jgi:hypothetical protein
MPESNDLAKTRREAVVLLGLDPARPMCPADSLRVHLVSTLRLVIDAAGETVLEGGTADIGRLVGAVEQLTKLLPKAATAPVQPRDRWRSEMLAAYFATRERAAQAGQGLDGLQRENERLRAEVEQLKALAGKTSQHSDIPTVVARVPVAAGNVVPLAPRSPPPATPQYDYDTERGWRDHVLPDGTITSTPFGGGSRKYWGPV